MEFETYKSNNSNNIFTLEPRLQEYLNRKRFYKKNNIESKILEREYQITKKDKEIINAYLNRNKALQQDLSKELHCEFIKLPPKKQELTSKQLMASDPRFQRLKNKLAKEKAAQNIKEDISNLSRNYDLFANTGYASMGGDFAIETREDNDIDQVYISPLDKVPTINNNSRNMQYNNKYFIDDNIDPLLKKHKQSNIQYNQMAYDLQYNSYQKHQPSLDNISENLNKYQTKINRSIDDYNSDKYYNNNVLNNNPCKRDQEMNMYKYVPELTGGELRDINIENYVKYGVPTSKNKSIGREEPFEHYFQYIDPDIQDPDHVCFDRPQMSRLSNKQSVRYKNN